MQNVRDENPSTPKPSFFMAVLPIALTMALLMIHADDATGGASEHGEVGTGVAPRERGADRLAAG